MSGLIILISILLTIIAAIVGFLFWRKQSKKQRAIENAKDLVVLKVLVPKEVKKIEEGENAPRDFKETMSVAEQFFTSFGSLHDSSWLAKIHDHQVTLSFEIIAKNNLVSFYVVSPKKLQSVIERQLHSFYPDAHIEPSEDFSLFGQEVYVAGSELSTKKSSSYPIRTYQNLESDPLNAITNAFNKLPEGTSGALQILIRPNDGAWRDKANSIAKSILEGKPTEKPNLILQIINGLFDIIRPKSKEDEARKEPVRLTPAQEEKVKTIQGKAGKVGFDTQIRLLVVSKQSPEDAQHVLDTVGSAYNQYTDPELNQFKVKGVKNIEEFVQNYILRHFSEGKMVLNTEELASLYHVSNQYIETPNIEWLAARTLAPPSNLPEAGTDTVVIGKSVFRGEERDVRIKSGDRRRHLYAVGKTGVGKTTLFINAIVQDIQAGRGVAYLDPNGDAIEEILGYIPKERAEDVILFDPSDIERPMGLNMLEWKRPEDRDFLVAEWLEIFYKLFDPNKTGIVGPQFEHVTRNASLAVMSRPEGGTLIDIPKMLVDDEFRDDTLKYVKDQTVLAFWNQQMAKTADFHKSELLNYIVSKFGRFMTNDLMRNIIGQTKSSFDLRKIMDEGKIFLVNLSKGKIGEANSYLLGMVLVAKMQVGAFQRANIPEDQRKDFYLYVDEFQNFTTDSFKTILSEARKYRLNLNITNQYIAQLQEEIRDAVIGNAGTIVTFRIGANDAEFLTEEFPGLTNHDIVNLTFANTYIKLLIDGTPSRPFSMRTIKTSVPFHKEMAEAIRQLSRLKYGKDRRIVEDEYINRLPDKSRGVDPDENFIPDFPPPREN